MHKSRIEIKRTYKFIPLKTHGLFFSFIHLVDASYTKIVHNSAYLRVNKVSRNAREKREAACIYKNLYLQRALRQSFSLVSRYKLSAPSPSQKRRRRAPSLLANLSLSAASAAAATPRCAYSNEYIRNP